MQPFAEPLLADADGSLPPLAVLGADERLGTADEDAVDSSVDTKGGRGGDEIGIRSSAEFSSEANKATLSQFEQVDSLSSRS